MELIFEQDTILKRESTLRIKILFPLMVLNLYMLTSGDHFVVALERGREEILVDSY